MSGIYSRVQRRIPPTISNAPFIHCLAHNLNLFICDTAVSTEIANNFFWTVQSLYNFFSTSAPMWAILALKEGFAEKNRQKFFHTCWKPRYESVSVLKIRYIEVLKSLTGIVFNKWQVKWKKYNQYIKKKKMESFQYILMLCFYGK